MNKLIALAVVMTVSTNALASETINPWQFNLSAQSSSKINVNKPDSNRASAQVIYTKGKVNVFAVANLSVNESWINYEGTKIGTTYKFNEFFSARQSYSFSAKNKLKQVEGIAFWQTQAHEKQGLSLSGYLQHIIPISKGGKNKRVMTKLGPNYRYGKLHVNMKVGYKTQGSFTGYYGSSAVLKYNLAENIALYAGANAYKNSRNDNIYSKVLFKF